MATLPIYNELNEQPTEEVESTPNTSIPVIEIDMNDPELTLFKVIKKTNEVILDTPDDKQIRIYFVSSSESTHVFWNSYFGYIKTLPNPSRLVIIYRGYFHLENIPMFLLDIPVLINAECKIIYKKEKLHDILASLLNKTEITQKFIKRFFEFYVILDYFTTNDLTELQILGLEFQTF